MTQHFTVLTLLLALIIGAPAQVFAESDSMANADPRLKSLMHTFYGQMIALKPYLVSDEKMKTAEGKKQVKKSLDILTRQIKKSPPETIDQAPGFRITYNLIGSHIQKTQEVFDRNQFEYTRMRLNAMTNFCVHCHAQIPSKSKSLISFAPFQADTFEKSFENAEFLFVTRQYSLALSHLDELARKYPDSNVDADQLTRLYRRKLAIFARVNRNPDAAITNLKQDLKNEKLPLDTKRNIESWIAAFEVLKKEKANPEKMSDEKLLTYIEKNIPADMSRRIAPDHSDAVNYLRFSGLLFERLMKIPESPLVPRMLYALALCEKYASEIYWYPMSEIYLKECVQKYPKTEFAKKCFKAYEKSMLDRAGTASDSEQIRQNIDALKKYL
jgi:hypothetical protein